MIGNPIGTLLLSRGRADIGFWWTLIATAMQVPGIYIGLRLGGPIGMALAIIGLHLFFRAAEYPFIVRQLLGPCLRLYLENVFCSCFNRSGNGCICVDNSISYSRRSGSGTRHSNHSWRRSLFDSQLAVSTCLAFEIASNSWFQIRCRLSKDGLFNGDVMNARTDAPTRVKNDWLPVTYVRARRRETLSQRFLP